MYTVAVVFLWYGSEKEIEDDHYLVPSALYEAAMVHLNAGQHADAKHLLTQAKYDRTLWLFCTSFSQSDPSGIFQVAWSNKNSCQVC